MAVALAWLLQRSTNILLIPGPSSIAHLRENVKGSALTLSANDLNELKQHRLISSSMVERRPVRWAAHEIEQRGAHIGGQAVFVFACLTELQ